MPQVVAHAGDSGSTADVTSRPDDTSAQLTARLEGHRILVTGDETDTSQTWVNPDGSFIRTMSEAPVRVEQPDGSFDPVDLTLTQNDNGSYSPTTTAVPVTVSDGGNHTTATVDGSGDRSIGLGWMSDLPTPTVKGGVATYAVSPTENLVVAATSTGFVEHIVLTAPPMSPVTFKVPLRLSDLDASQASDGAVTVTTPSGTMVAHAQQFNMWDASAGSDPRPDEETAVDTQLVTDSSNGDSELELTPNMSYLTDPSTQYPVTIDPSANLTAAYSNWWYSGGGNTSPENTSPYLLQGTFTSGSVIYRSYVNFNLLGIPANSFVDSATLKLYQIGSETCTPEETDAWDTTANDQYALWSSSPGVTTTGGGTASFNSGAPGCGPNVPTAQTISIANLLNDAFNGTITWHGIEIAAPYGSENNNNYGKIFCSAVTQAGTYCNSTSFVPTISLTYQPLPSAPTGVEAEPTIMGSTGEDYITSYTPTLYAAAPKPDGGQDQVQFFLNHDPAHPEEGTGTIWGGTSSVVAAGATASVQVPNGYLNPSYLAHLKLVVRGVITDANGNAQYGPWSSGMLLVRDVAPPVAASVSCTYPSGTWSNRIPSGDSCTASDTTDSDFGGVYYSYDDPNPNIQVPHGSSPSTSATIPLTSSLSIGWHTLYVQTYDHAYNRASTITKYTFGIGVGGLTSPSNNATTQRAVTLSSAVNAPGVTGVTYYYRIGTTAAWQTIPTGDVTYPGTGTHPSWPESVTAGTPGTTQALTWNVQQTVTNAGGTSGPVQLIATYSGTTGWSSTDTIILSPGTFGSSHATSSIGPGTLSLLTGDLDVNATDASVTTAGDPLTVGRDLTTLTPSTTDTGATGIFGPAWTADLPSPSDGYATDTLYTNPTQGYALLSDPTGTVSAYLATSTGYPYSYIGIGDADDGSVLTQTSSTAAHITETDGTTTYWTYASSAWQLLYVAEPGSGTSNTTNYLYDSAGQVLDAIAGVPGVSCTGAPFSTDGCRTLTLNYATSTTATGTSPSQWGNYYDATNHVGRLQNIQLTAWDPSLGAMSTVTIAEYAYDSNGLLRGEWDPRISPTLETTYSYGTSNRLTTITPPGLNGDTINYDSAGRVASVQWTDPTNGTATQAVAYALPTTGSGAPIDMSSAATTSWGQSTDLPYTATEVFPPDHVPSTGSGGDYAPSSGDYPYGSISYLDVNGYDVDDASYGAGAWQVNATQYDSNGNTVWALTANNRNQALTPTADTDPLVANMATSAQRGDALATTSVYAANGYDLTDTYGPTRPVTLNLGSLAGTVVDAQDHTHYVYNQGAPSGTYDLITETDESPYFSQSGATTPTDYSADTRSTLTGYNPVDGSSPTGATSGWILGQPTKTSTVMPGGSSNYINTETEYDGNGNVTESIMPKGAASPGTDAYTTDTGYYTTGTNSSYPACSNHPEWAGLACQTGPAAQPSDSGSLGTIPTSLTTYNMYDQPVTVTATSGSATKTTTLSYDSAGRQLTDAVVDSTSGVPNIPTTTTSYDPSTGLATTVSSTAGTITTGYNALGQVTSYTVPAASGTNTTTTTYTIDGQVATVNDGKGTTGYTYNGTDSLGHIEHRGLVTSESTGVSGDGNFTGAYDADGNLTSETYPNGLVATRHYDNLDEPTSLNYSLSGASWATFQDSYNDFGQVARQSSPESSQAISYDQDARISQVADTGDGTCATRVYGYDADSNRTSLSTYPADSNGNCSTSTTAVSGSYGHDQADRLTSSGYAYDPMGRTTVVPAGDTNDTNPSPTSLSLSYDADDMVHTQIQDGITDTFTLDPSERVLGETNSSTGVTSTDIYSDGSDSPAWTSNSNGTWSRNIMDLDGGLAESETAGDTAHATLQLVNLHGDVIASASDSASDTGYSNYSEGTEFGSPRPGKSSSGGEYGWLGGKRRSSNDLGGLVLMGERLYESTTGRFLSVDPVPGGSANRYDYCDQDPLNQYDTSGRSNEVPVGGGTTPEEIAELYGVKLDAARAYVNKISGRPYDKKLYNVVRQRMIKEQKFSDSRNVQKRLNKYRGSGRKGKRKGSGEDRNDGGDNDDGGGGGRQCACGGGDGGKVGSGDGDDFGDDPEPLDIPLW